MSLPEAPVAVPSVPASVAPGPAPASVELTSRGAVFQDPEALAARLAGEFSAHHCLTLRGLLGPRLLEAAIRQVEAGGFEERVHEGIGSNRELCLRPGPATGLLHLLLNSEPLFQFLERVTRCPPIGSFQGRVYRVVPGQGHHDAWHSDLVGGRLLALSLNLGRTPFAGGRLQIRDRASEAVLHDVANTGPGDALVFRLAPELQHRITEMEGSTPKTAFAGWFSSGPTFRDLIERSRAAAADPGSAPPGGSP